MDKLST